ncbi:hypothetical protein AWM75_08235 [Aerococcus urinaehominis]|uniref:Uncharacterized protein n=1 Tax=Aerococcus urinaehominis TaxID=128944 RepID=A0A0X8FMD0_9LACT|nr:YihY/virulence factor BrkB family protein [Aerococcus urinaehominis]AMB99959.1 hypothetical protein AWM75_08235 [Aerococcus urinaehominis]SDM44571.1 membrane protein [Aerococcus urinaehominis]
MKKFKEEYLPIFQHSIQAADIGGSAAQMAYYMLLALFPVLLLVANIIPLLPFNRGEVLGMITMVLPQEIQPIIMPILLDFLTNPSAGAISITFIVSIWSASKAFNSAQKIMNKVYDVEDAPNVILNRLISFLLTIALVVAVGLLSIIFVFGGTIIDGLSNVLPIMAEFRSLVTTWTWPLLLLLVGITFIYIYQFVPRHHMAVKYQLPGALLASLGMLALSGLFSIYMTYFGGSFGSGTIGTFIILMFYLYLISILFIVGGVANVIGYRLSNRQEFYDQLPTYRQSRSANFPNLRDLTVAEAGLTRQSADVRFTTNRQFSREERGDY